MVHKLWIHEDDQYMRCLWPAGAAPYLANELQASVDAAQKNVAPDGMGYTAMHVAKPPDSGFAPARLSLDVVIASFASVMPRFDQVEGGYGSHAEHNANNPLCFGFGPECYIYIGLRDGVVDSVFFDATTGEPEKLGALREAIMVIDRLCPAALVDYWVDMSGIVSDDRFMSAYFAALAAERAS